MDKISTNIDAFAPADGAALTVEVVDEHAGKHPAFQMLMGKIQIMRLKLLNTGLRHHLAAATAACTALFLLTRE